MKTDNVSFYRYFPVSQRDRNWGLYATTAGEAQIAPHATYPPAGHPKGFAFKWQNGRVIDEFALVYISRGRGHFEQRKQKWPINAGNAFLLFPQVWHRYSPDPKTGWREHWIGFDGDLARRWLRETFIGPNKPVVRVRTEDLVQGVFTRITQAARANQTALQQILAGATHQLMGLIYSAQQAQPNAEIKNPNAIERAISRLQNEFHATLDMQQLARDLGISYSWFRHSFAAHTGLSPHQYLLELRLAHARNLLGNTELSIKRVAAQTGFTDELYFSRLFRQKLKVSPTHWRQRNSFTEHR